MSKKKLRRENRKLRAALVRWRQDNEFERGQTDRLIDDVMSWERRCLAALDALAAKS